MMNFLDSLTNAYWSLDDGVVVTEDEDGLVFHTAEGELLAEVPATLVPVSEIPAAPPPILTRVPQAVSLFQGRQALRLSTIENGQVVINDTSAPIEGKRDLLAAVEELLARATTPAYYREAWNDIQQFERDSPMLMAIGDELGLPAASLDDLFIFAATLRA